MCSSNSACPVLRHVVLLKFKEGITPEQIQTVEQGFADLKNQIDAIQAYEWGIDTSHEKLGQGFTHCSIVTFADEAARDAYLVHPAHKAFAGSLGPVIAGVLVVDFLART